MGDWASLKYTVDLVKPLSFLSSVFDSSSVLLSLCVQLRSFKTRMTVSTLMDFVPYPQKVYIFTPVTSFCSPRFTRVFGFSLSYLPLSFGPLLLLISCPVLCKVWPWAPLFGLLCTPLGKLGFLFNKCLFVLTEGAEPATEKAVSGPPERRSVCQI